MTMMPFGFGEISSPTPYLSNAKEIYILQGEVRLEKSSNHSILIQQGISVVKIPHQKVWLVFRNHHLNWQSTEIENILQTRPTVGKRRQSHSRYSN